MTICSVACVTSRILVPLSFNCCKRAKHLAWNLGVAYRQRLVNDKNIGINLRLDSKRQPDSHAAGICFDGLFDKLADVGKGSDIVKFIVDFRFAQTEHCAIHVYIFTAGKFRVEA